MSLGITRRTVWLPHPTEGRQCEGKGAIAHGS